MFNSLPTRLTKNFHNMVYKNATTAETAEKKEFTLYDLVDLARIFKVTKRTIFNWREKELINLINIGGRLYMTQKMLEEMLVERGGVL